MEHTKEINLADVDWNNLSPEEFQKISQTFAEKDKLQKSLKERKSRTNLDEKMPVTIRNVSFELPVSIINRLKSLRDGKPKEKLIDDIFLNYKPIEII